VKTVRFTEIVKRCGAPETHLILTKPTQDNELQKAIKAHRVMTVFQETTGTRTDSGKVGFEEGAARQYLVFPKSLRPFANRKVIGIKYDLLSSEDVPKSERARAVKVARKHRPRPSQSRPSASKDKEAAGSKVVAFRSPKQEGPEEKERGDSDDLAEVRRLARQAMDALEAGKQIAAFNLLKRIATS
jgi:hypothetical protein